MENWCRNQFIKPNQPQQERGFLFITLRIMKIVELKFATDETRSTKIKNKNIYNTNFLNCIPK